MPTQHKTIPCESVLCASVKYRLVDTRQACSKLYLTKDGTVITGNRSVKSKGDDMLAKLVTVNVFILVLILF